LAARAIGAARTVAGADARIGIAGRNLVTGQRLSIAADQSYPAASVDKLALLVEAYRQTASGTKTLSDSQQSDLRAMIILSDNDAANRLLELFGSRAVNANLQALGLIGTRLINPFGSTPPTGGAANVTTPSDMARLMEMLAGGQLVSTQASTEMRALLLQTQDGSKLRRGLPTDAKLAHKSGWFDGVANDVGIVTQGSNSYVIAVFTDGIPNAETANQTIAAVAKTVHEAWGAGQ
jgi:beta-lactamase class A